MDDKFTMLTGLERPKRQQIGEWLKIPDGWERLLNPGFTLTVTGESVYMAGRILKVSPTLP